MADENLRHPFTDPRVAAAFAEGVEAKRDAAVRQRVNASHATGDLLSGPASAGWVPDIPEHFRGKVFGTYEDRTPEQERARRAAERWTQLAINGTGKMLALVGREGVGKSHLLYAAAQNLIAAGRAFYCRPWYLLADELRYGGRLPWNGREVTPAEVRALVFARRIVLLDNVRPTASTALDESELDKIASWAYDNGAAVFLNTAGTVASLSDVMGRPAASRFHVLEVKGPNGRSDTARAAERP